MASAKRESGIPEWLDLNDEIAGQISTRPGGQRCLEGEGELLLIVHEVPEPKVPEREAHFYLRRPDGTWDDGEGGGLRSLRRLVIRYQATIDRYEAAIEEVEEMVGIFEMIRHTGPIARSMRNLKMALNRAVHACDDREVIELRDRAADTQRAAELLYQDAKLTLDFRQAENAQGHQEAAERLNVIAYRLNLLAGFFLPMVALGAIFGMNVRVPDVFASWFWLILATGALLGVALVVAVGWNMRKSK